MRDRVILAAIFAAGAAIRFYRLDLTWFLLDQVRDVSAAAGIATGTSYPLLGPRIGWTDAYLGPLYHYLLAIPLSLTGDPVAGAVFISLSHLVALLALYRFAKEFYGARVALFASALFAVFPLTLFSSRLVWHAGLLPPLVILYMHALYRLVLKGQSAAVVLLLALLAVMTQVHLTSIALAAVALVAMLWFRPRVRIAHLAMGGAAFLVLYLPYVVYECAHRFENLRALLRFSASEQGVPGFDGLSSMFVALLLLFSRPLTGFFAEGEWPRAFLAPFWALYYVEALLFAIGLMACLSRLITGWRRVGLNELAERQRAALLLLWVSVPVLILGNKKTAIWWYYLDVVYPGPFILAGIALSSLPLLLRGVPAQRRMSRGLACLAAAIVLSQAYFQLTFQRKLAERGEMTVAVPKLSINAASVPFDTLVSLPLGYRNEIIRVLIRDFGVRDGSFFQKVHGAVLGLAEENRYLVAHLSERYGVDGARPTAGAHYLVAKAADGALQAGAIRSKRVGPYAIFEHRSIIDYDDWSCAVMPRRATGAAEWRPLRVPTSDASLAVGEEERLLCRGRLHVPMDAGDVKISVSTEGWALFEGVRLHIGGRLLTPVAQRRRQDPLMLRGSSGWLMGIGWASETVFDLTGSVPSGESIAVIELAGAGTIIALDVYEGRSW